MLAQHVLELHFLVRDRLLEEVLHELSAIGCHVRRMIWGYTLLGEAGQV